MVWLLRYQLTTYLLNSHPSGCREHVHDTMGSSLCSRTSTEHTTSIDSLSSPILPTGLNSDSAHSSVRSGILVHLAPASMLSFASTSAEWNRGLSRKFTEWSRLVLAPDIRLLPGYPFRLHNSQRISEERSEGPGLVRMRSALSIDRQTSAGEKGNIQNIPLRVVISTAMLLSREQEKKMLLPRR